MYVREAERAVRGREVVEVVCAVLLSICGGGAPERLDAGVVASARQLHLCVSVNDRASGPPEAVPEEERVYRVRVFPMRRSEPAVRQFHAAAYGCAVEPQRVGLREDEQAVVRVVLRRVRGGQRSVVAEASEQVLRRALLGLRPRVVRQFVLDVG